MEKDSQDTQNSSPSATKQSSKGLIMDILSGNLLTREVFVRQLPFIFFLIFLAFLQIANSYSVEKLRWEIKRSKEELKGLRAQSLSIASELMFLSNQTEVVRMIKARGIEIEESAEPPKKIIISKKERKEPIVVENSDNNNEE